MLSQWLTAAISNPECLQYRVWSLINAGACSRLWKHARCVPVLTLECKQAPMYVKYYPALWDLPAACKRGPKGPLGHELTTHSHGTQHWLTEQPAPPCPLAHHLTSPICGPLPAQPSVHYTPLTPSGQSWSHNWPLCNQVSDCNSLKLTWKWNLFLRISAFLFWMQRDTHINIPEWANRNKTLACSYHP